MKEKLVGPDLVGAKVLKSFPQTFRIVHVFHDFVPHIICFRIRNLFDYLVSYLFVQVIVFAIIFDFRGVL